MYPKYNKLISHMYNDWNITKRLQYNSIILGKKIFSVNFGGWYGYVKDMEDIDDFIVARPNGREFVVNIHDIRQLEDDVQENKKDKIKDEFSLDLY